MTFKYLVAGSVALLIATNSTADVSTARPQDDIQRRLQVVTQIQQLQAELRELRGQLEQNVSDVSNLMRRQREFYLDLDRRLIELESRPRSPAGGSPTNGTATGTSVEAGELAGDGSPAELQVLEQQAYQQAFDLLKVPQYNEAIDAYGTFLQLFPAGEYADNARYWIGEAYYVTRVFDKALIEFNQLLELHPTSSKRADTTLKIGYIYYEQKRWEEARQLLTEVVNNPAGGTAARLAQSRLERMTEEGH